MKNINRFKILSFLWIAAYLLSACGGTLPQPGTSVKASKVQANLVAFTGIVEAINASQWTVNGQQMTVDPQTFLAPNIVVGDRIRVEASVSPDGTVVALKVESAVNDDVLSSPSVDVGNTSDPLGMPTPDAGAIPDVSSNMPNPSITQVVGNNENEVFGVVEAITVDTITVSGVTYNLAIFTELKDSIDIGDQVKLHMIINADGWLTIREIEKSDDLGDDNSNSNNDSDIESGSNSGPDDD